MNRSCSIENFKCSIIKTTAPNSPDVILEEIKSEVMEYNVPMSEGYESMNRLLNYALDNHRDSTKITVNGMSYKEDGNVITFSMVQVPDMTPAQWLVDKMKEVTTMRNEQVSAIDAEKSK